VDRFFVNTDNFQIVDDEGGMEQLNRERGWSRVATKMHYPSKQVGSSLRVHYERILYPFYVFKKGHIFDSKVWKKSTYLEKR
jgi:histone demethylase JARID1